MFPQFFTLFLALVFFHGSQAANPLVDFDRMGKVGLAGAFAGLDFFNGSTAAFDPTTSTLLSRASDGSLTRLASTNVGGSILTGCALGNVFYLAGSFSSVNGVSAANIASYTTSSGTFAALGSGGPNGQINTVFCDTKGEKVWVGGKFSAPGASVAIFDIKAASWSGPPFAGISGAGAEVTSITTNSSDTSLFFSGSFVTAFGNANAVLNGTNNPNVPFSPGASPFSSSLVPIPLTSANIQIQGQPSSLQTGFTDIRNALCPAGADGPGNSWFAQDNSTPLINVQTFSSIFASGVRLGNTFQPNHGTTGFSVTTLPDNKVQTLKYVDPTTGQNQTCTDPCPLSTDPSVLYQDFLFNGDLTITGVQIKLSQFTGSGPGLHILQLLSSGAFASSIDANNGQSCFAPNPSNTTKNGDWFSKVANTKIPGTVQTVLVSDVIIGTPSASGPSFTWNPYISGAGDYDVNLLIPGCTNFQDCPLRTDVKVQMFPGPGLNPIITTISQTNQDDASVLIYSGPVHPSTTDFGVTITMSLADEPSGNGQGGKFEIIADRVQFVLKSATVSTSGDNNGSTVGGTGLVRGFGFLEWPLSSTSVDPSVDGKTAFPNTTLTALDSLGFDLLNGMGGTSALVSAGLSVNAVAHHPSGIFVGGLFTLTSGPASGSSNIVIFKNGALASLAEGGLNGEVTALALIGDQLFVGGSFNGTESGSTSNLRNIAVYDIQKNSWSSLDGGLNGNVASLGLANGQLQVAGNFTETVSASNNIGGISVTGFANWDIKSGSWVNSGGFVAGKMTFIGNSTSSESQFIAGNVAASQKFGASGLVMLKNNGENGPSVTPLSIGLDSGVSSQSTAATKLRRRSQLQLPSSSAWISHMKFSHIFSRQSNTNQIPTLSAPLPAPGPAVLAGAFWTNKTSNKELTILGGNFTFTPPGSTTFAVGVAIYDPISGSIQALSGPQINGTVRTLLVDDNSLYVGGEFTLSAGSDTAVNGLALYDLAANAWDLNGLQILQPSPGSSVVVRSISKSTSKPTTVIVAGSFSQAGSLSCQAICSFDTVTRQWNALGNGIQGQVASVSYAGDNQNTLIAAGSISLSDNTASNVVQYSLQNATWSAIGSGSDIPGPISAVGVNSGNASSIFAAGKSTDGSSSFLSFWDGNKWSTLGSTFQEGTTVAQLTMVPLQNSHDANGVIESDRVLMISGSLSTTAGNSSSALFDGRNLIPFIVSTSATGSAGSVSSLFHSFSSFSFSQRKFLATGVVILISIAIAAGVVFLLALIGILWTLFSRKEDKLNKYDVAEDEDDDSTRHRPSSLLEHINAATRTTIIGASPYSNSSEKEEQTTGSPHADQDPFGPDASNYMRAETPSDAVGGLLGEETSRPAHARYSFDGTGEGELPISSGAEVEVLDDRDPAWWYARDVRTGQEGVVPAAYLY
ncbi:Squalestatin S1 biosynthesis cluster protein L1 [Psilocybe cubensis]|uniref:Squalestatin S1 biosynthesis cluster protein L1 n=2 Tax=Psilocybe cubensis TaxID=181762 RepID=A0ACB8HBZ8_PSICU|nr:Squalestatin S1 biosynthesis cluster protein L1 [Psilocybe cubensis]KAH9485308.1 Squalestatin S1 biosynthesis cluster protein L1 [Psilocybe cubensis]